MQLRDRRDDAVGPGPADHEQAGFVAPHVEELARALVRHHGAQHVLGLRERRDLHQVIVRRRRGEIHVEILRREPREHVAVFQLHGAVVLEVHDRGVEQFAARRRRENLRRGRRRRVRVSSAMTSARCSWPRCRISSAMPRISSGCARACRSATKLPTPATRTSTPSSRSSLSARFAVMREMPKLLTISLSDGTRAVAAHLPEPMFARMWRLTCKYSGSADAACFDMR